MVRFTMLRCLLTRYPRMMRKHLARPSASANLHAHARASPENIPTLPSTHNVRVNISIMKASPPCWLKRVTASTAVSSTIPSLKLPSSPPYGVLLRRLPRKYVIHMAQTVFVSGLRAGTYRCCVFPAAVRRTYRHSSSFQLVRPAERPGGKFRHFQALNVYSVFCKAHLATAALPPTHIGEV